MSQDPANTPVFTFVLWSTCLLVGVTGAAFPSAHFTPPVPPQEPPPVELIKVELTDDPIADPAEARADSAALPMTPPSAPPISQLEAPPAARAIPVATPETVTFAIPVEGPTLEVAAAQAAYAAPVEKSAEETAPATVPTVPQQLTYGQGQGRQPKPHYPYQAIRRNETGTVRVRFTVGEDGRVSAAEVVTPCESALLNSSAVSTIRNRWRFPAGRERLYEVDISFQLQDQTS